MPLSTRAKSDAENLPKDQKAALLRLPLWASV